MLQNKLFTLGLADVLILCYSQYNSFLQLSANKVSAIFTFQLNVSREHATPSAVVQREPAQQQTDIFYASISFSKIQEDPLYSNIMSARPNRHNSEDEYEDVVEYTMVSGNGTSGIPR